MGNDQLKPEQPQRFGMGAGLWKALNSPFVLFLMSSVAVTGITKFYTDRQATIAARQETRAQLAKLLLELQYRISRSTHAAKTLETFLGQLSDSAQYSDGLFQSWMKATVAPIRAAEGYQPASPEFARVHTAALLQQIDLRSGDLRAELLPANGGESPLEAALELGDEQVSALGNLTDAKRITRRSLDRLKILEEYLASRKSEYLCDPSLGGTTAPQCQ